MSRVLERLLLWVADMLDRRLLTVPGSRRRVTPLRIGAPPKLFVISEHSSSVSGIVTLR
jgi:hypothetical protein